MITVCIDDLYFAPEHVNTVKATKVSEITADFWARLWKGRYAYAKTVNVQLHISTPSAWSCPKTKQISTWEPF